MIHLPPSSRGVLRSCSAIVALLLFAVAGRAQETARVRIEVRAPADAAVTVDGIPVVQKGTLRKLITPELAAGQKFQYTLKAVFDEDGATVAIEKVLVVEVGKVGEVDLTTGAKTVVKPKSVPVIVKPPVMVPEKKVEGKPINKVVPVPKVEPKPVPVKEVEMLPPPRVVPVKEIVQLAPPKKPVEKAKTIVVPFVTTPTDIVKAMLKLAAVTKEDTVYDLGCGDGRITIAAVKDFGAKRGLGIDIDAERVKESKANARIQGVEKQVEFTEGDVLAMKDFDGATVIALYMLPQLNQKLAPLLKKQLKPGSRIVSHDFDLGPDWKADQVEEVRDSEGTDHKIYLWVIPGKK